MTHLNTGVLSRSSLSKPHFNTGCADGFISPNPRLRAACLLPNQLRVPGPPFLFLALSAAQRFTQSPVSMHATISIRSHQPSSNPVRSLRAVTLSASHKRTLVPFLSPARLAYLLCLSRTRQLVEIVCFIKNKWLYFYIFMLTNASVSQYIQRFPAFLWFCARVWVLLLLTYIFKRKLNYLFVYLFIHLNWLWTSFNFLLLSWCRLHNGFRILTTLLFRLVLHKPRLMPLCLPLWVKISWEIEGWLRLAPFLSAFMSPRSTEWINK